MPPSALATAQQGSEHMTINDFPGHEGVVDGLIVALLEDVQVLAVVLVLQPLFCIRVFQESLMVSQEFGNHVAAKVNKSLNL